MEALGFLLDTVGIILANSNQGITELIEGIFEDAGLANLQAICLNNCNINTIDRDALIGLSNLKTVNINMNAVADLPEALFPDADGLL